MPNRSTLDALAAAFFAPLMVFYALTGAAHLSGARTMTGIIYTTSIDDSMFGDRESIRNWLSEQLQRNEQPLPDGPLRIGKEKVRWGHLSRLHVDVRLIGPNEALVDVVQPTLYGKAILLHKAKGGRVVAALAWLGIIYLLLRTLLGIAGTWRDGPGRPAVVGAALLGAGVVLAGLLLGV